MWWLGVHSVAREKDQGRRGGRSFVAVEKCLRLREVECVARCDIKKITMSIVKSVLGRSYSRLDKARIASAFGPTVLREAASVDLENFI